MAPLPPPTVAADKGATAGTATVLLVEDEADVREVVGAFLRDAGYVVHDAGSGADAERVCAEVGHIDLLVCDVVIPDTDGPDLARRLREQRPGLKTLLISGYPSDALSAAGMDDGASYLPKPFSRAVLLRHVRDALK